MTHIDQIIADALAGSPETHVAILAREVVRLREALAVVVPDLDQETQRRIRDEWGEGELRAVLRGYDMARTRPRAIPADRVLGDGMAAVPMELLERLYSFVGDSPNMISAMQFQAEISDALRANQGGDHD